MALNITKQQNPYIIGRPITEPERFFGREDIFQFINDKLNSDIKVIVLYGQRRIGKSSVLYQIPNFVNLKDFHFVQFDLQNQAAKPLGEVLHELAETIVESVDALSEKINLPSDPSELEKDTNYFHKRFLPEVYKAIEGKSLLLLLDEFDVLGDYTEKEAAVSFFPYLQKLLQKEEKLFLIAVVGRRLSEVPTLLNLFREAQLKKISLLDYEGTRRLITKPAEGILDYDDKAIQEIFALTAGHPYCTQLTCNEAFSYLKEKEKQWVTVEDIQAVVGKAIESGRGGLDWFHKGLPLAESLILSAVSEIMKKAPYATRHDIQTILEENGVEVVGTELANAPDSLVGWDILKVVDGNGYKVTVELVRRWVVEEHPLRTAMQDLEFIDGRAIGFYEQARKAHNSGNLDEAIKHYREALRSNPNHFSARLGLAEALSEDEDFRESVIEYEKAYKVDKVKSRDGLVKARLSYGRDLMLKKQYLEAEKEFYKVLKISPENKVATERLEQVEALRRRLKRLVYATVTTTLLLLIGAYAFFYNSYYISTKTNPFGSPWIVVRSGRHPAFDFLPGLGKIIVETDFTTDQLSEDQKSEYLDELAQGKLTGLWFRKYGDYRQWIEPVALRLNPVYRGLTYLRLGEIDRGIQLLKKEFESTIIESSFAHIEAALGEIGKSQPDKVIPMLEKLLAGRDSSVRWEAARALEYAIASQSAKQSDPISYLLTELKKADKDSQRRDIVRQAIVSYITDHKDMGLKLNQALIELRQSPEPQLRISASIILENIPEETKSIPEEEQNLKGQPLPPKSREVFQQRLKK